MDLNSLLPIFSYEFKTNRDMLDNKQLHRESTIAIQMAQADRFWKVLDALGWPSQMKERYHEHNQMIEANKQEWWGTMWAISAVVNEDHYEVEDRAKEKFPQLIGDSETGNLFLYGPSKELMERVSDWLKDTYSEVTVFNIYESGTDCPIRNWNEANDLVKERGLVVPEILTEKELSIWKYYQEAVKELKQKKAILEEWIDREVGPIEMPMRVSA